MELTALVKTEQGTFKGCSDALQAYQAAKDNDYYLELLSVINPTDRELVMLPYTSSASVGVLTEKQFSTVTVMITVDGDKDGRISAALASAIAATGIKTMGGSSGGADDKMPYALLCTVSFAPVTMPESSNSFVRYVSKAELLESATGKTILSWSKNARVGKLSADEAEQAAVRTLENDISTDFSASFKAILK